MVRRRPLIAAALTAILLVAAVPLARAHPAGAAPVPLDHIGRAAQLSQPRYPHTIRTAVDVPMADGAHLYVEVVRPDPARHGRGPWPVILEASPYHGTLADRNGTRVFPDPVDDGGNPAGLTGYFAPRGYAVVMVDLRGTGRSSGCLDHLGPRDAADLKAVVEWAASRPWSNGRVGMTGHSYVAATTVVAAAQRPKGLVTIVPSAGLASMYDHQFNKGVPWLLQWVGPMAAYEELAISRHLPAPAGSGDNVGGDMEGLGCGTPQSSVFAGSGQLTGQYESWHAARDWNDEAADLEIPVFMIHGIHDNAARIPAAEWFFANRFERDGDKVWIGQWDHGAAGATACETPHPTCRFAQYQYALHAWFDAHLQQRPGVDTGPPVTVFLNGGTSFARPAWSKPQTTLAVYPDATDGSLRFAPPEAAGSAPFGTVADVVFASGTVATATFTSRPLTKDIVLLGLPTMRLDVSQSYGQVVDVVTTLWREAPDGERTAVTFCGIQPQLRHGVATVTPVVPGEVMALEPQCFTTAQLIPAGDRLVLEVGTTSQHHASRGSDAAMTVHTGPSSSAYRLPRLLDANVVADVPLHLPAGTAQAPIEGTAALGPPTTEAYFEFESAKGADNASARAVVTDIEGDVDVYLDKQQPDASWREMAAATSFDVGGPEVLRAPRLHPGTYRLRIANYASVPGEIGIAITFFNGDGTEGA